LSKRLHIQFSQTVQNAVVWITISANVRHWLYMPHYSLSKRWTTLIVKHNQGCITGSDFEALHHHHNLTFVLERPTGLSLGFSSIKGIINFDKARQHLVFEFLRHRLSYLVHHVPNGCIVHL